MKIKFNDIQFNQVNYKVASFQRTISTELKTKFDFKHLYNEDDLKLFGIEFMIGLNSPDALFQLNVIATAHFSTTENIDEEFKTSQFAHISAPSIAFPYIRTFISNLTLNSGYNPVVLPTFNFVTIAKEKDSKSKL